LDQLPLQARLDNVQGRAEKYAYHFFFRRMIPMKMFAPTAGYPLQLIQIERLCWNSLPLAPG